MNCCITREKILETFLQNVALRSAVEKNSNNIHFLTRLLKCNFSFPFVSYTSRIPRITNRDKSKRIYKKYLDIKITAKSQ